MTGDEQQKTAKTAVWWDLDNSQIPQGIDGASIPSKIRDALLTVGYEGPLSISIYGDVFRIPRPVLLPLYDSEITTVHHIRPGRVHTAFQRLVLDLFAWSHANLPSPNCMIISDDGDMITALERLRMKNVNVLLAHTPSQEYNVLAKEANKVWRLDSLLAGGKPYIPAASVDDNQVAAAEVEEPKDSTLLKTPAVSRTSKKAPVNECENEVAEDGSVENMYSTRRSTRIIASTEKAVKINSFLDQVDDLTSNEAVEVPENKEVEDICNAFVKLDVEVEECDGVNTPVTPY